MYAIQLHEFGPAENLVFEEVPDPEPGPGQVRIKVEAAGVHLVDTVLRAGTLNDSPIPRPELPTIPGREVAGTIDAVGPETDTSWIGKRVVVHLGMVPGGYAELAVAKVDSLHEIPPHLDAASAVATIGTGRTAIGILEDAALTPDDVVLITAAAGGLGSLFIQSARNIGATVVALAGGPEKVAQTRALGAPLAFDYNQPDWPTQVRTELGDHQVTVILDGVGGPNARLAYDLLAPGGRLLLFGWSSGTPLEIPAETLTTRNQTVSSPIGAKVLPRLRSLESKALTETTSGRWHPLTTPYPLAKAADAHQALETRQTTGKVVLIP
ncbi:NADPH2:quinone reductase [Kribbella voronezhensis]|uniref:NADPH2:quinone reductase n=1 Tax=Kribbella voronezhensis TaxID=2512212 RepID=A0A4R7SZM6_9ACTN|nr:zinc-binding dehydrogenase [Kribbella voronezhensis]TDU84545.1 NADPH2:quinone reductase [Kribbella voronezhensis]